ncbi:MAG TPA: amidohydrolase family protein [Pyrinomonadaceae bacterium]|nr:amidohydrolase family protein [Pyrinomonadaceae bacterium]
MAENTDKFIDMVTASARVELPLSDFAPRHGLRVRNTTVERAKFPCIDYHNHLDAQTPRDVLTIMDACNIERVVNITMQTGEAAFEVHRKFKAAAPNRFETIAWFDWSDQHETGFWERSLERLERFADAAFRGIKLWKDLGLTLRDANGEMLRVDDERLAPFFEKAGELGMPVMFHTADPDAFFLPIDRFNERYEELAAHPDWGFYGSHFSKDELLAQRDSVFPRHPKTTFVCAHLAEKSEDLAYVGRLLDLNPNLFVDIGARTAELGRQPYTSREFFLKYADRIVFGTDLVPDIEMYRLHFRFLETRDEYFDYPSHASRQGRWQIYGIDLPDDVLKKLYRENALRLLEAR